MSDTLTSIRRSFELFNEGRVDAILEEIFDPEIDYSGDPEVSALGGWPTDVRGAVQEIAPGQPVGSAHMLARGGSSQVPIDAPYYFAWVVRRGRQTFLAAKLHREEPARRWKITSPGGADARSCAISAELKH